MFGLKKPTIQTPSATSAPASPARRSRVPEIVIHDDPAEVVLTADLPGVAPDAVEVTVAQGVLTIKGGVPVTEPAGYTALYREYEPRDFERSFTLPNDLDGEAIQASVRHGVLRVVLPRATAAKPRRIAVKTA